MVNMFRYHDSSIVTKPRNCDFNIKGLELEISSNDWDTVRDILEEMEDKNILTTPYNRNTKKKHTIAIEEDGSVQAELIFKACGNKKLLEGVKVLEEYLNPWGRNSDGTSCHIHINRRYLRKKSINSIDIVRATEFLYPILFKISGRSEGTARDWARSYLKEYYDISFSEYIDLYERSRYVDNIDIRTYQEKNDYQRYLAINLNNSKTIELRLFSNKYNFNYNYIKMYLESVDFIIKIAEFMKDKRYRNEYKTLIKKVKRFYKKYEFAWNNHNLENFFISKEEMIIAKIKEKYDGKINSIKRLQEIYEDVMNDNLSERQLFDFITSKYMQLIRILRDFNHDARIQIEFNADFIDNTNYIIDIFENEKEELINNI